MEWAEASSLANRVSTVMASGPGYAFKQLVADVVAGGDEADAAAARAAVDAHAASAPVALFSFTSCPFCRKARAAAVSGPAQWLAPNSEGAVKLCDGARRAGRCYGPARTGSTHP